MNDISFVPFLREQEKALAHIDKMMQAIDMMPDSENKCEHIYSTLELCRLNGDYLGRKELSVKGLASAKTVNEPLYELFFTESLAASLFHLGNYDEAFSIFIELEKRSSDDIFRAKAYNGIGCVFTELEHFAKAEEYHLKALELRQQAQTTCEIMQSYNNLSYTYFISGDLEKSIEYAKKGIALAEHQKEPDKLASLYYNLGSTYRLQNNYETALDSFFSGLDYAKNAGDRHLAAQLLCCIGITYTDIGNYTEALSFLNESLTIAKNSNCCRFLAKNYKALSMTHRLLHDYKRALEYRDKYDAVTEDIQSLRKLNSVNDKINTFHLHLFEQEKEVFRLKNNELLKAFSSIEQKNKDLMKVNTYKDYILNIAVHDLRNTVGQISSIYQLIGLLNLDNKLLNRYCDMGGKAVDKSLELVDSIMTAYQMETKSFALSSNNHVFQTICTDVLEIYTTITLRKNISLHISMPEEPITIMADKLRFVQIIDNILSNAVKFTPQKGSISFSASVLSDINHLQITIADTGIGIPQKNMEILFDQFTAARRKGTDGESTTGLGMSIVKKLVEMHNGTITIDSQVNIGTTITLFFPLSAGQC